jgi:hypothetical protein
MVDGPEAYPEVDDGSTPGALRPGRVQEARWRTISVPAVSLAVREALSTALRRGITLPAVPHFSVKGLATRDGFVLQVTTGARHIGVELTLVEFENTTRVQISVPVESRPTDDELQQVTEWAQLVFAKARWAIR